MIPGPCAIPANASQLCGASKFPLGSFLPGSRFPEVGQLTWHWPRTVVGPDLVASLVSSPMRHLRAGRRTGRNRSTGPGVLPLGVAATEFHQGTGINLARLPITPDGPR